MKARQIERDDSWLATNFELLNDAPESLSGNPIFLSFEWQIIRSDSKCYQVYHNPNMVESYR